MRFESLKMNEDENIVAFFHRVDEVVNTIKGLNGKIDEASFVQKILISLPIRFNSKILAIEEMKELGNLNVKHPPTL